jgi:hypothetical protein
MANGAASAKAINDFITVEIARNMAHGTVRVKFMVVVTGDAGGFLAPMLKRM